MVQESRSNWLLVALLVWSISLLMLRCFYAGKAKKMYALFSETYTKTDALRRSWYRSFKPQIFLSSVWSVFQWNHSCSDHLLLEFPVSSMFVFLYYYWTGLAIWVPYYYCKGLAIFFLIWNIFWVLVQPLPVSLRFFSQLFPHTWFPHLHPMVFSTSIYGFLVWSSLVPFCAHGSLSMSISLLLFSI